MSYASQEHTPLWSPELCALRVPPMWASWVLLLWLFDHCGCCIRCGGPSLGGCLGLLCVQIAGSCWLLELCLEATGFGALRGPGTCDSLLVGGNETWHEWLWALGCPRVDTGPLMSGARAWGYWLRGSRCPQPDVGLTVIRHWVQRISGQVPDDWYV